jgi:putative transposase
MRAAADPARREALDGFRVVEFSIQHDHLHLIVEAMSRKAMARGMKGLTCRIAKAVNRALERAGAVFADRYHVRALATPTEVRHALRYVLQNAGKHDAHHPAPDVETCTVDGIDPCSSARWFTGWRTPPPAPDTAPPVSPPRTWLLREGWRRLGLLVRR